MAGIAGMGTPNKIPVGIAAEPDVPEVDLAQAGQFQVAPSAPQAEPEIDYDALAAEAVAADDGIDYDALAAEAVSAEAETAPEVSYLQEIGARFKAGFGGGPQEKKKTLDGIYGAENVEIIGDDLYVKKDGKRQKFTRGMLDMLGDAFNIVSPIGSEKGQSVANLGRDYADLGRSAITEAVALPFELAGSLAGTAGAGPIGTAVGFAGGRAVGGALGEAVATGVGELLDSPFKEGETGGDVASRAAVMGGARAVLGAVADKIAGPLVRGARTRLANDSINTIDNAVVQSVDELNGAVKVLEENGIDTKIRTKFGDEISYTPGQAVQGKSPKIAAQSSRLTAEDEMVRVENTLAQKANNAISAVNNKISQVVEKGRAAVKGSDFLKYVSDTDEAEGALIGEFRKKAAQEAGDGLVVLNNTKQKIEKLGADLGLDANGKIDPQSVINAGLADTEPTAKAFISYFENLYNLAKADNGRISLKDLDANYQKISRLAEPYWKKNTLLGNSLKDLWRGVRDDYTQGVKVLLDEGKVKSFSPKTYEESLVRFTEIKGASDSIKSVLNKSDITSEALAGQIFTGGQNALQTMNAVKTLLKDSPETWSKMKADHLKRILDKATNLKTGDIDGNAYFNSINKLPEAIKMELVGGPKEMRLLKAAQVYVNRIQNFSATRIPGDKEVEQTVTKLVGFTMSNRAKSDAFFALLGGAGNKKFLKQYLSGPGQIEVLKQFPTNKRAQASKVIDQIIAGSAMLPSAAKIEIRESLTPNFYEE